MEEWSRSVQLLMSCSLAISTRSLSNGVSLLLSFSFFQRYEREKGFSLACFKFK